MRNKTLIPIILGFCIIGGIVFYYWVQTKRDAGIPTNIPPQTSNITTPETSQEKTITQNVRSREDLEKIQTSSSYEIQNIKFDSGGFDCCFCAAIAAQYKHQGGKDYLNLLQDIAPPAMMRNMAGMMDVLKKYNLDKKLYIGYYYQGKGEDNRTEIQNFFSQYLANPKEQIILFKDGTFAYQTLQKLISQDIPVMIASEEDLTLQSIPQNETGDNTFNLIVGYDAQKITYYTLPSLKTDMPVKEFQEKWKLQDTLFPYPVIPGNYTMIFLLKPK